MCWRRRGRVQRALRCFDAAIPCPLNRSACDTGIVSWMCGDTRHQRTRCSSRTVVNLGHIVEGGGLDMLAAFNTQMLREREVWRDIFAISKTDASRV